ncbi:MAG: hypothetical protein WBB85_13420, partial [Albidovulum sp.]|uniref:hypothetical protein n=1 Tax=Albidovulum sp. TaxID=1872424 RepID=UPI003C9B6E66
LLIRPIILLLAAPAILAGAAHAVEPVAPLRFLATDDILSIPMAHIERAAPVFLSGSSGAGVEITFSEDMDAQLAAFTTRHVGEVVDIAVCDTVLVSPKILEPVSGKALIPLASIVDATSLAERLRSDVPCGAGANG